MDLLGFSPVRLVAGAGMLDALGGLVAAEGLRRVCVVTDAGVTTAGHAARANGSLRGAGIEVATFAEVAENPTSNDVEAGLKVARTFAADGFVALGGGSVMDCAKAVNLLLTNGGTISDYRGEIKPPRPLKPSIAVPTTAGTGSEAQSFALIADPRSHLKHAIGDRRLPQDGGMRPIVAVLDPELTATQPQRVAALSGIDAISHAVETAATTARNDLSLKYSKAAWDLLATSFVEAVATNPPLEVFEKMLLGAHLAGLAIENSMLGAAHACANPLTARFQIPHGQAVGVLLPHVVEFNGSLPQNPYFTLGLSVRELCSKLANLLEIGGLSFKLRDLGVPRRELSVLASEAADQWTARFNPRPVTRSDFEALYEAAW